MSRAIVLAAAGSLIASASALAGTVDHYWDTVRPHGRPRSDAVFQAALRRCYQVTGASRFQADTATFRSCMLSRGYRWQYVERRPGTRQAGVPAPAQPEPTWTDPETGLPCHSIVVFGIEGSSCGNI